MINTKYFYIFTLWLVYIYYIIKYIIKYQEEVLMGVLIIMFDFVRGYALIML